MLLNTIFAPFVKERPICVMARAVLERRFCRKFSFEAICGMISLHDQQCLMRERDDGDQF